jgi:hypothetical protein
MVIIRHAENYGEVLQALQNTNVWFGGNVIFNRCDQNGGNFSVTLKTTDACKPGSRISTTGRRMPIACWHVYGRFFDELFALNPAIVVVAMGKKITKDAGNWQDQNIGSIANPMKYSEACNCCKEDVPA